jgi:hypothetical protein
MRDAGSLCEDAAWISLEVGGPGEAPMFEKIGVVGCCKVLF